MYFLRISVFDGGKGRFSMDEGQRKRYCFKCISISVDTAWVEPRGWGGSNYHLSAPEFSHSCLLHPKQLLSEGPTTYCTLSLFLSASHTSNTHPDQQQTSRGSKKCWHFLEITRHSSLFNCRLSQLSSSVVWESFWAPRIHQELLWWHLWWVRLMQACCVALCVGTRHLTYFH